MAGDAVRAALAEARAAGDTHAVAILEHALAELDRSARGSGEVGDPPLDALSRREREVLRLLVTGKTDKQIAQALVISPRTVQSHVASALHKTGTSRRTELMALAISLGVD